MLTPLQIVLIAVLPASVASVVVWLFAERREKAAANEADSTQPEEPTERVDNSPGWPSAMAWCLAVTLAVIAGYVGYEIHSRYQAATSGYGALAAGDSTSFSNAWDATLAVAKSCLTPLEAKQPIPAIGIAVVILTAVMAVSRHRLVAVAIASLAGISLVTRQLWTSIYVTQRWSQIESVLWLGGAGITIGCLWWSLSGKHDSQDRTGYARLFCCGAITGLLAVTLASSGSITYGVLAGVLAASLGGAFLSGVILHRAADRIGWSGPAAMYAGMLLVLGCAFAELRLIHAGMFALALGLTATPMTSSVRIGRHVLFAAIALAPAAVATVWAVAAAIEQAQAANNNPYDAYL